MQLNVPPEHVAVQAVPSAMTPEERVQAFQSWVENFPYRRTEPLSDEAISREGFYQRRCESR
jgi:hypothetical protein